MTLSAHFNRTFVKPWGVDGGEEGGNSLLAFKTGEASEWRTASELFGTVSNGKFRNVTLHWGDRILIEIGGGGGYGNPLTRDPDLVYRDWDDQLLTTAEAAERYAVVLSPNEG
jgi:N-methylhydantoinase B